MSPIRISLRIARYLLFRDFVCLGWQESRRKSQQETVGMVFNQGFKLPHGASN